jgi:hypothetical protein
MQCSVGFSLLREVQVLRQQSGRLGRGSRVKTGQRGLVPVHGLTFGLNGGCQGCILGIDNVPGFT